jgi:predicted Na+-dependent transporter
VISSAGRWLPWLAGWLDRWLILAVLAAAGLGIIWPVPARALAAHNGISAALIVLVAATGFGLPAGALQQARAAAGRVLAALAAGALILPALAFAVSRLVAPGPLRLGVLAAGVAPSEVASVALAVLAGGQAAIAVAVLVGSTAVCVLIAAAELHVLAGGAAFSTAGLISALALIIALPLLAGAAARKVADRRQIVAAVTADQAAMVVATVAVLVLIWLVAGQAHPDARYLRAGLALLLFLAGSTLAGAAVGVGLPRSPAVSLLLPVAMRDFAIAAGIATAAFGPAAAAPLGIYGILVLLFGAAVARLIRPRQPG